MHNLFKVSIFVCVFWMVSCHPEREPVAPNTNTAVSTTDGARKQKIREVSAILRKIYKDPAVRAEVNAAIHSGYYEDERVMLTDLLYPEKSALYQDKRYKDAVQRIRTRGGRVSFEAGVFGKAFRQEVKNSAGRVSEEYFTTDGVNIYFPYSENHIGTDGVITTVDAVVDANEAIGYEPYQDFVDPVTGQLLNDVQTFYRQVTVNDDYADAKPTHIVGISEKAAARVSEDTTIKVKEIRRVLVGYVRCTKQYDNLVSFGGNGGGSEIVIVRISGYLKQDTEGQITQVEGRKISVDSERSANIPVLVGGVVAGVPGAVIGYMTSRSGSISRRDIRRKNWVKVNALWDMEWQADNKQQVLAVYEEDTRGEQKIDGSLTTTMTGKTDEGAEVKRERKIGYSVTVKSEDAIATQLPITYNAFFSNGKKEISGCGFYGGWPVYDCNLIVSWTMPYEILPL